jgi:predicted Fe-Mo cluster-binding NifX family protein
MNIIIPVTDNQSGKDIIAESFHNADYVCIYDSTDQTYEWVATKDISIKAGNLSLELKRKGIYTVITSQMMPMALALFIESGFKVYKAQGNSVKENVKLYHDSLLAQFTFHSELDDTEPESGCNSSCGSCHSSCK